MLPSITIQTSQTLVPSHPTMGLLTKSMVRQSHLKEEEKNIKDPFSRQIRSQLLACSKQKHFIHPQCHFEAFSKDKKHWTRSYRNENHYKDTFQNHFQKHIPQTPLLNYFQTQHFLHVLIETRTITKAFSKYFQSPHHKHIIEAKVSNLASN